MAKMRGCTDICLCNPSFCLDSSAYLGRGGVRDQTKILVESLLSKNYCGKLFIEPFGTNTGSFAGSAAPQPGAEEGS